MGKVMREEEIGRGEKKRLIKKWRNDCHEQTTATRLPSRTDSNPAKKRTMGRTGESGCTYMEKFKSVDGR